MFAYVFSCWFSCFTAAKSKYTARSFLLSFFYIRAHIFINMGSEFCAYLHLKLCTINSEKLLWPKHECISQKWCRSWNVACPYSYIPFKQGWCKFDWVGCSACLNMGEGLRCCKYNSRDQCFCGCFDETWVILVDIMQTSLLPKFSNLLTDSVRSSTVSFLCTTPIHTHTHAQWSERNHMSFCVNQSELQEGSGPVAWPSL